MKKRFLEGIVKRHPDGFGFLIPDDPDHPDVYVPRHSMNGIMTNDRILVEVEKEGGFERYRGELVRVIKRAFVEILGRFHDSGNGGGLILDEGHGWGSNLTIESGNTKNAKDGDFVKVTITSYPNQKDGFCGKVCEILGKHGDPLLDVHRVIHDHAIPSKFSDAAREDAKRLPKEVHPDEFQSRRDLTKLKFVTIDGATAKDFDDAIYVEQIREGFHVWVAIADVSHYVKPHRPIDKDAYERGTSTYFPNFVVPMLPEELSNELCSLKPNVFRLSLVAEMKISFNGDLLQSEFYEAVIKSHARVIYGEAQEVIDGFCPEKLEHVKENILKASDVAKILLTKRNKDGSLQLEIGETQLVLNELGEPVDIIRAERVWAHKVIEELMLIANVAVAKFFKKNGIDGMYRIHEPPREEAITLLNKYLLAFGSQKQVLGGNLQKKLTRALENMHGTPHEEILNILTLRSMNQAQYSPDNVGHFGLGFSDYTHFTSPIRRYPDLIVHRLLKSLVVKGKGYQQMSLDDLKSAGTHLSACEQRSVKCERQFNSIKKARFITSHIGKEFDGVISGVAKFGVFVLLREYDVDGLVKVEELGNEPFEYNEENLQLVAKRSKFFYEIGMPLRVQVVAADIDSGRIEFILAGVENERKVPHRPSNKSSHKLQHKPSNVPTHKGKRFETKQKPEKIQKNENRKTEMIDKQSEGPKLKFKNLSDYLEHRKKHGGQSGASKNRTPDRSHPEKRGKAKDDRGGAGKARVRKRR